MSSKNDIIFKEGTWMIPIEEVVQVKWSIQKGKILENLMSNTKRPNGKKTNPRWLSEQLINYGCKISYQHIYKLKCGKHDSVSIDFVLGICKIFNQSPSVFISGFYVGQ